MARCAIALPYPHPDLKSPKWSINECGAHFVGNRASPCEVPNPPTGGTTTCASDPTIHCPKPCPRHAAAQRHCTARALRITQGVLTPRAY